VLNVPPATGPLAGLRPLICATAPRGTAVVETTLEAAFPVSVVNTCTVRLSPLSISSQSIPPVSSSSTVIWVSVQEPIETSQSSWGSLLQLPMSWSLKCEVSTI
jgi:hypothetical protein